MTKSRGHWALTTTVLTLCLAPATVAGPASATPVSPTSEQASPTVGPLKPPRNQCAAAVAADQRFGFESLGPDHVNWSALLWSLPPQSGREAYRFGQVLIRFTSAEGDDYVARVKDSGNSVGYWYRVRDNKVVRTIGARAEDRLWIDVTRYFGRGVRVAVIPVSTSPSVAGFMWEDCEHLVIPR